MGEQGGPTKKLISEEEPTITSFNQIFIHDDNSNVGVIGGGG